MGKKMKGINDYKYTYTHMHTHFSSCKAYLEVSRIYIICTSLNVKSHCRWNILKQQFLSLTFPVSLSSTQGSLGPG